MNRVHFSSVNDRWQTPEAFYKALDAEFRFTHDPCPVKPKVCGLSSEWGERNFVNPPYSDIKRWVEKAYQEAMKGKLVVLLIPSRTDTRWWHSYIMKADEIRFVRGRLKFEGAKFNAPFPSCVVIYTPITKARKRRMR